jgi:type III restriction enzyme
MKLHFEPNLDYQLQAIEAVCDLFRGQEVCRTEFTVTMKVPVASVDDLFPGAVPQQLTLGVAESHLGVGNRLTLLDDELLKNLGNIQLRIGIFARCKHVFESRFVGWINAERTVPAGLPARQGGRR